MKTLGRILVILAVFSALSALMVFGVNASGLSNASFPSEGGEFRPDGDFPPPPGFSLDGDGIRVRPDGFEEHDHEERGERGRGFGGLMFGALKNTFLIAVLVMLVVFPRNAIKKRKKIGVQPPQ